MHSEQIDTQAVLAALRPRFLTGASTMAAPARVAAFMAVPAEPEASSFALSRAEWISLQLGMANLDRVAQTMRNLGADMQAPATQAAALAQAWQSGVFPAIRALADDIRSYARLVVELIQPRMQPGAMRSIARVLVSAADAAQRRAAAVCAQIDGLERGCAALRANMADLHAREQARIDRTEAENLALRNELTSLAQELPQHQQSYHHAVTVAATTVTYGWIPLFGWIAGATVAGIHGRAAVVEKEWIDKAADRSAEIMRTLAQQERQWAILTRTLHGLTAMGDAFRAVQPVLQHTQGIWAAICSDLGALRDHDPTTSPEMAALVELELQAAQAGWRAVATRAEDYLRHAEVQAPPDTSPFGNFRTQTRYANQTFVEHHVLQIDLCGVRVNEVPVAKPVFEGPRLHWAWEAMASRHDKPESADIRFGSETAFEGTCTFPMEGPIGWIGTRI